MGGGLFVFQSVFDQKLNRPEGMYGGGVDLCLHNEFQTYSNLVKHLKNRFKLHLNLYSPPSQTCPHHAHHLWVCEDIAKQLGRDAGVKACDDEVLRLANAASDG